jgi:hypothetical protein
LEALRKNAPFAVLSAGVVVSVCTFTIVTGIGIKLAKSDITNLRGDEQYFISGVVRILAGESPFADPSQPPYLLTGYTPAAYYATAWCAKYSRSSPDLLSDLMHAGRALAIFLTLVHICVLFYLMRMFFDVRIPIALIACAIVYSIRMPWGFVIRPDPLFSVFFILGVILCVAGLSEKCSTRKSAALTGIAGLISAALFLTKQTGVQLPLLALIFYAITFDLRRFVAYAAGFTAPLIVAMVSFPFLLGAEWASSVFVTNASGLNVGNALRKVFGPVLIREGGATYIALAIPPVLAWSLAGVGARYRFLAFATLGTLGFSTLTAFSSGSAEHYFNDSLTLVFVSVCAFWGNKQEGDAKKFQNVNASAGAFATLFLPLFLFSYATGYLSVSDRLQSRDRVRELLQAHLEKHPGAKFLTVDNALANFFPDNVLVPQFQYAVIFRNNGAIDVSGVQELLDDGRLRWCVVGADQDLNRQLGFLGLKPTRFTKGETIDGFAIWTYRD